MHKPVNLDYNGHKIQVVTLAGETWIVAKNIVDYAGRKNTSLKVSTHCDREGVRTETIELTPGKPNTTLLVTPANARELMWKFKPDEGDAFEAWLTGELSRITGWDNAPDTARSTADSPAKKAGAIPKMKSRKSIYKRRTYLIGIKDYAALGGVSKSTAYARKRKHEITIKPFNNKEYVWITDRDDEFQEIAERLENDKHGLGLVAEWKITIIG